MLGACTEIWDWNEIVAVWIDIWSLWIDMILCVSRLGDSNVEIEGGTPLARSAPKLSGIVQSAWMAIQLVSKKV